MNFFIYVFISIAASSLIADADEDNDQLCMNRVWHECDVSLYPRSLPYTVEELKQKCSDLKIFGECVIKVNEGCAPEKKVNSLRKLKDFIDAACEENSHIFQVISQNFECVTAAYQKVFNRCYHLRLNKKNDDTPMFNITSYAETQKSSTDDIEFCLAELWGVSCKATAIGLECGSEVGDAAKEILEHLDTSFTLCDDALDEVSFLKASVSEDIANCHTRGQRECSQITLPMDYPDTIEELTRHCNMIYKTGICYIKAYEDCQGLENHPLNIEKFVKFVEDECQEDSHLFQEISRNIECVTPAARSLPDVCTWEGFSEDEEDKLITLIEPVWEKGSFLCVLGVEKITCAAHVISRRCGSQLKEAVTTILENTDGDYGECTEELLQDLAPFKEYYEEILANRRRLEYSIIEKK